MAQWLKFNTIDRFPYDQDGNILTSIKGRRNRKGIDEINGGGTVYPEIVDQRDKILEWYEKDGTLLLGIDILESEAEEIKTKDKAMQYQASPKAKKDYNHKDFKAEILTDEQAEAIKKDVFKVVPNKIESGVT